jgi:Tol biopolymer transport system component/DNA-binding winged helix-turn-helix (wHTH) protein
MVRFGAFEVDFERGEIRKAGSRLRLPGQAFEFLQALLERPGELVTREELRQRIWTDDTFVDFDHGLNVMVNRLREVLGDSARSPFYIETVPRKGYRFIATLAAPEPRVSQEAPVLLDDRVARRQRRPKQRWWTWAAAAAILTAAGAMVWWVRTPSSPAPDVFPITTFAGSKDFAAFSPDGAMIAFAWVGPQANFAQGRDASLNRDIYVKLVDTGAPLRLTAAPEDELLPAWSPDGRHVAFLRKEGPRTFVYLVPSLGGTEKKVCEAGIGLAWSPDGKTLAIAGPPDAKSRTSIVLHTLETGAQRRLTLPEPYSDSFPAFSPDGRNVAFLRSFTSSARELMLVPAAGGEPKRLTFDQRPIWGAAWTADGELVYSANRGVGEKLYRISVHGGTPRQIVVSSQSTFYPAISRQGHRLAYTEEYNDSNIYLYHGPRFLPGDVAVRSTREDHSPQISPDGQRLAFVSRRSGNEEIWVSNQLGEGPMQLTSFAGPGTGSPRWSPDGKWIAFDSRARGSADLYVVAADGSGLRRLTDGPTEDMLPAWSSDGQSLYFVSNRSGPHQLWKMPVAGGAAVQLTHNGAYECSESPDGKVLYFTKGRAVPGIWSLSLQTGAETLTPELAAAGYWRSWGVTRQGVYFAAKGESEGVYVVRMYRFSTRQVTTLATLAKEPLWLHSGLALSADGNQMWVAQLDQAVNDLMLIENFR